MNALVYYQQEEDRLMRLTLTNGSIIDRVVAATFSSFEESLTFKDALEAQGFLIMPEGSYIKEATARYAREAYERNSQVKCDYAPGTK